MPRQRPIPRSPESPWTTPFPLVDLPLVLPVFEVHMRPSRCHRRTCDGESKRRASSGRCVSPPSIDCPGSGPWRCREHSGQGAHSDSLGSPPSPRRLCDSTSWRRGVEPCVPGRPRQRGALARRGPTSCRVLRLSGLRALRTRRWCSTRSSTQARRARRRHPGRPPSRPGSRRSAGGAQRRIRHVVVACAYRVPSASRSVPSAVAWRFPRWTTRPSARSSGPPARGARTKLTWIETVE